MSSTHTSDTSASNTSVSSALQIFDSFLDSGSNSNTAKHNSQNISEPVNHDYVVGDPKSSSFDVPSYESSYEICEKNKKQVKSKKQWVEGQRFQNADDAKTFIKKESSWSIYTTNTLKTGKKVIYRCINAKLRGKQCEASIYLFYPSNKTEVTLFTAANQHTRKQKENRMTDGTKAVIEQLFKDGFKTRKAIQCKLASTNIQLPTKNQLNNFISKLNVEHFGVSSISLGELEVFLRDHSSTPVNDNEAFIVDYTCDDAKEGDFKFFVSTKMLLRNAVDCQILSADTTYKMTWQGFPISPVGTVDKDRKFHLFGTLVSKEEKTDDFRFAFNAVKEGVRNLYQHNMNPKLLISDAAEAIHNGAKSVFGAGIIILMCWFHAKKAVKKNITRFVTDTHVQAEILDDMSLLNQSNSKEVFDRASVLFLRKYSKYEQFCSYFKMEWLVNHRNKNCAEYK